MDNVEQLVFGRNGLAENKRMLRHVGLAGTLMNAPCSEGAMLTLFQNAPSQMLDEIRDLNQFESQSDKLTRKLKESPFFGIGLVAMAGVCAAGVYRIRRPLAMPTPQYLMQLRVAAQSACVGSVVAGAAYTMATQSHNSSSEEI